MCKIVYAVNFNIAMKLFVGLKHDVLLMHWFLLRDATEIAK